MNFPHRGDLWLVNLDPTLGSEIKKTRPALIISNDINNEYAQTITVIPVSDMGEKSYPFEVALPKDTPGLDKASKAKCQQIRTIDKMRLIQHLGKISEVLMESVDKAVLIHLGINF